MMHGKCFCRCVVIWLYESASTRASRKLGQWSFQKSKTKAGRSEIQHPDFRD